MKFTFGSCSRIYRTVKDNPDCDAWIETVNVIVN